jgi:hypothetical protein
MYQNLNQIYNILYLEHLIYGLYMCTCVFLLHQGSFNTILDNNPSFYDGRFILTFISYSFNYFDVTHQDKRALISLSVSSIQIDVNPIGENLILTTYACPQTSHIWQPFTKLSPGRNHSATAGRSLGPHWDHPALGGLILPLFCQP